MQKTKLIGVILLLAILSGCGSSEGSDSSSGGNTPPP